MRKTKIELILGVSVASLLITPFGVESSVNSRQAQEPRGRPNVVIIYGDDVGYGDVGAYGAERIPTPNIDRLAKQGLLFTDAHCAAATCTPSRYSLLTGEMPFRKRGTQIAAGDANMIINPGQFTLADLFQQSGYRTAIIGKWHLGLGDKKIDWNQKIEPGPEAIGFDHYFIFPATNDRTPCIYIADGHVVNLDPADPITVFYDQPIPESVPGTAYPDGKLNPESMTVVSTTDKGHQSTVINGIGRIGYMKGGKAALFNDETLADVFVEKALRFISENRETPFFLFFSANDIHAPRWPHERFRGTSQHGLRGDAMVSFDWSAGAILEALKEHGLEENTIVILSSDNGPVYIDGGYQDGSDAYQKPGPNYHAAAGIYRGGKYRIYEGGTRIPFIVRWPGQIEPGGSDALFTQVDLLASFAAMLDVDIPFGEAVDSRNVLPTLLGEDPEGPEMILTHARDIALRRGTWKYLESKQQKILYDLASDPSERNNVVAEYPEIAKEMGTLLKRYKKQPLSRDGAE